MSHFADEETEALRTQDLLKIPQLGGISGRIQTQACPSPKPLICPLPMPPTVSFHKCRFIINSVMKDLNYEVSFSVRAVTGPGGRPRSSPGQTMDVQLDFPGT